VVLNFASANALSPDAGITTTSLFPNQRLAFRLRPFAIRRKLGGEL
jgi:hypothetical protein